MDNFSFHNPVRIRFGKGTIAHLATLLPQDKNILLTFGSGSIKKNGVYQQVKAALAGRSMVEFGGIEPNPRYETLMKAVALARAERIDWILSVGGGSVLDGSKFIAAAVLFNGEPWDILSKSAKIRRALPLGCILTLPATGSEMNAFAVISKQETREKRAFASPHVYPAFSILDPQTTLSLPPNQTANGVIDAFAHVLEQYLTYPAQAPLQDRQAEAILLTLLQEGPKVIATPQSYEARANIMWCAAQALNGSIACGVPQDWSTHTIGHELTALYGLDHAQTLAVVFPAVMRSRKNQKREKLLQYAERVWSISDQDEEQKIDAAIAKTESFFRSLGVATRLKDYGIVNPQLKNIAVRIFERDGLIGEGKDLGLQEIHAILQMCLE